jgi:hypothetical protein
VFGGGLDSPYVIVQSEAHLHVRVALVEVVVVEAPVLKRADLLRDHLLPNS